MTESPFPTNPCQLSLCKKIATFGSELMFGSKNVLTKNSGNRTDNLQSEVKGKSVNHFVTETFFIIYLGLLIGVNDSVKVLFSFFQDFNSTRIFTNKKSDQPFPFIVL